MDTNDLKAWMYSVFGVNTAFQLLDSVNTILYTVTLVIGLFLAGLRVKREFFDVKKNKENKMEDSSESKKIDKM